MLRQILRFIPNFTNIVGIYIVLCPNYEEKRPYPHQEHRTLEVHASTPPPNTIRFPLAATETELQQRVYLRSSGPQTLSDIQDDNEVKTIMIEVKISLRQI